MSYATPWSRVYPDLPTLAKRDLVKRLTIELPKADADEIMSVACNAAIFSLVCQTALKSAADFIRTNNITYANSTRLIDHICQRTVGGVDQTAAAPHVPGRVEGIHDGVKDVAEVTTGTGKKTPVRSRSKGNRGSEAAGNNVSQDVTG